MLAVLCAGGRVARAESELTLSWHAPPGCPSLVQAGERLVDLTGDEASQRRGHAVVHIDRSPSGELRARITLLRQDGSEQRVLYGHSCEALADAALLVIGMALEGEPPNDLTRPHETNRTETTRPWRFVVAPAVSLDFGALPRAAWGFGGAVAVQGRRLRAELDGRYWLSQQTHQQAGHNAELGLVSGALRGCYTWFSAGAWPGLASCAGVEFGRSSGRGVDLAEARPASALWAAALLGLDVSFGPFFGRVAPHARAELGLPFQRASFDLEGGTTVFQAARLIGRLALVVDLTW